MLLSVMRAEKTILICYVHMTADYDDDHGHNWDVTIMSSVSGWMHSVLCIALLWFLHIALIPNWVCRWWPADREARPARTPALTSADTQPQHETG